MGGTQSSSSVSVTNNVINSVFQKEIQNCGVSVKQYQNIGPIVVSGNGSINNSTISQVASVNVSCLQSSSNLTNLQNSITSQLQQLAEANGSFLSQALNKNITDIKSDIANEVKNTYTSESIKNCGFSADQTQIMAGITVTGNGSINGLQIQQATNAYLQCVQQLSNNLSFKNALDSTVKTQGNSDSSFFNTSTLVWIGVALLVFIAAIVLIIRMTGGPKTGGAEVMDQGEIEGYFVY